MKKSLKDFNDIHHHCNNPNDNDDCSRVVNLNYYDNLPPAGYYSIGIHPWLTVDMSRDDIDKAIDNITDKATDERVVAIGECGIDQLRGANAGLQEYAFRRQIELSERLEMPLIIHMVKSADTIIRLKKEMKPKQTWIIHGFRGKPELTRQLTGQGISISFGKHYNEESLLATPTEMRYFETDEG